MISDVKRALGPFLTACAVGALLSMCSVARAAPGDTYAAVYASPASLSWWTPGHAFVCLSYELNAGIKEECYGFYPSNETDEAFVGAPSLANEFKKNPERFNQISWSIKKRITDQQRQAFFALVGSVNTGQYHLLRNNCGDFVSTAVDRFGWRNVAKAPSPEPYVRELYIANIARFTAPSGTFQRTATGWQELDAKGKVLFSFIEATHDSTYITLRDNIRNVHIRLPVRGGMSHWRGTGSWTQLHGVTPMLN